jgi:hypothetical protein
MHQSFCLFLRVVFKEELGQMETDEGASSLDA